MDTDTQVNALRELTLTVNALSHAFSDFAHALGFPLNHSQTAALIKHLHGRDPRDIDAAALNEALIACILKK